MSNRNQLRVIVEEFGYDDSLTRLLMKGCSSLPEAKISALLLDIVEVGNSIPALFELTDSLILGAEEAKSQRKASQHLLLAHDFTKTSGSRVKRSSSDVRKKASKGDLTTDPSTDEAVVSSESSPNLKCDKAAYTDVGNASFEALEALFSAYIRLSRGMLQVAASSFELISRGISESVSSKPTEAEGSEAAVSAAKSAPVNSDVAVNAVKSAIAAATAAFDSMNKAAKQMAEIAEANVAAGSVGAKGAAKRANGK